MKDVLPHRMICGVAPNYLPNLAKKMEAKGIAAQSLIGMSKCTLNSKLTRCEPSIPPRQPLSKARSKIRKKRSPSRTPPEQSHPRRCNDHRFSLLTTSAMFNAAEVRDAERLRRAINGDDLFAGEIQLTETLSVPQLHALHKAIYPSNHGVMSPYSGFMPADSRFHVCILGGPVRGTQTLVKKLAAEFVKQESDSPAGICRSAGKWRVFTEGMPGVQETFVRACTGGPPITNLLHSGAASNFPGSEDFAELDDAEQRMTFMALIGDIYICIGGDDHAAEVASLAYGRKLAAPCGIIPVMSTFGATGGGYGFPVGALQQPVWITDPEWRALKTVRMPQHTAQAIKNIVQRIEKNGIPYTED